MTKTGIASLRDLSQRFTASAPFGGVAGGAGRVAMINDRHNDETAPFAVDHVTGERAHAFQRTRFEERLSGDGAVLETSLDGAVGRRDRERRRKFIAHRACVRGEQQARKTAGG